MEDWSNNAWLLEADNGGFHVDDCVYEEDEIGYVVDDDESLPWEQHVRSKRLTRVVNGSDTIMLLIRPRSYVARILLLSSPSRGNVDIERVQTATGVVQVTVCGDRGNPPLITYHDVGLNHSTCFQNLMLCADTSALLLRNFCVFHVDAPGHEEDAEEISSSLPLLSADDLAEQVAEVARHFALADVTLMGVTAGAYVLTLFALSHRHLVRGLILVSPLLSPPSWAEWAHNKVSREACSMQCAVQEAAQCGAHYGVQ
ncbi:unnamed protein product [Closterium sp. Yama58-4]|nr:unnamed protein product [Closterium sp. Yama58-4]